MSSADRILWIDAGAGASGDMLLGALIELGVSATAMRRALAGLPLGGWTLRPRRVERRALAATEARVVVRGEAHGARRWRDIKRILDAGRLDADVHATALRIFRRLFEAEGRAHGLDPDRVHLHEAGATDAVIDIVGASFAVARLAPRRIVVSPLTTGSGTVACAHGDYPVPGPATTWLLRGVPVSGIEASGERLTPTGAAVLTTIADSWGGLPAMRPLAVGHGAGSRDYDDRPNVLRAVLGESHEGAEDADEVVVLECTLDDATPQLLAYAVERVFEAGALDVFTTGTVMKKGRSGHLVTVLARPESFGPVSDALLRETTTLGVRFRRERRLELDRPMRVVSTPYGKVRVKVGVLADREIHAWPEYEDCASIARRRKIPLFAVQQAALEAHRAAGAKPPRTSGRRRRKRTGAR